MKTSSSHDIAALLVAVGLLMAGCGRGGILGDSPTPHERYADALRAVHLDSTALGRDWIVAADSVLREPLQAELPMEETGVYLREQVHAMAHGIALLDGQQLRVAVRSEGLPARIFVDLFEVHDDVDEPFRHVTSAEADSTSSLRTIVHEARRAGEFIVRIQPELLRDGRYTITLRTEPILAFPVSGQGNRAIQSRFGVDRDAGRRQHEGIDIFAPRGTPVLAAMDGEVRSIRPNQLGGLVVWLHDGDRDQSLYYAHLDSQAVTMGDVVQVGDTLGFVGNTGNAVSTPPHLHFGIYRRPGGAIDPFPWVAHTDTVPPRIVADTSRLGQTATASGRTNLLRAGPSADADSVASLAPETVLRVMGATASWYRVQGLDGRTGYLRANTVELSPP